MKKLVLFCSALLVLCLIPTLTSCKDEQSDTNLYTLGIKVIRTMEEMVASDDYSEIMGGSAMSSVLDEVRECNFTRPVAVYSITPPSSDKLLELTIGSSLSKYDLSENLIKQLENRVSFSTILTYFNAQMMGSSYLAFSSVYQAIIKDNGIIFDTPVIYMYVFEDAPSIFITFANKTAVGQFCFTGEDTISPEEIKKTFEMYCTMEAIPIP